MVGRTSWSARGLLAALSVALQAQTTVPKNATFRSTIDNSDQPYALYLPKTPAQAPGYPLLISLHHEDFDYRLNLRQVFGRSLLGAETEGEAARRFPTFPDFPFLVAVPLARGSMGYQGIAEQDIYDLVADLQAHYPVDPNRIYLTGISAGGAGALWLGLTRPDLWAAIVAVSADRIPEIEPLAGNGLNLAIDLFHGEDDPLVPPAWPRHLLKRFLTLGVHAEYTEYPLLRHNTWDRVYRNAALFDLVAPLHRNPFPDRVRFSSPAFKYAAAYWVRLDRFTPGDLATIDAHLTAPNRVEVTTKALDGFTLALAGHPKFNAKQPLTVIVDGADLHPKGRDTVSFVRAASGWTNGYAPPAPTGKRPGLEGPIAEAIARQHMYVYGTADDPSAEVLERRRHIASTAAEWTTPRSRLQVAFAVKADRDVTDTDLASANLILFGKRETNSLIARFAPKLPIELNPSAADFGLVFIAPVGAHYVLVDSGLPWWMGADQVKRSGWRQTPAPWHVLAGFGDYILFKGSLEHVVAEGRFDRNWEVPEPAARQMLATGAVTIPSCCQMNSAVTATR